MPWIRSTSLVYFKSLNLLVIAYHVISLIAPRRSNILILKYNKYVKIGIDPVTYLVLSERIDFYPILYMIWQF